MRTELSPPHFGFGERVKIPVGLGYGYDSNTDIEQVAIDDQLGERIASGDEQALDLFIYRWRNYVVYYVKRRIYNSHDADEIIGDVFIQLWEATRAGRWRYGMFVRFFYGVLRRAVVFSNHRRNAAREKRRREIYAEMTERETPLVDEAVEKTAFDEALMDAVLKLRPRQRLAFRLVHIDGYRQKEASEIMGLPPSVVHYHLRTACQRLQKSLAGWR